MAISLIIAYNRVLEDEDGKIERIDEMFEMYKRKPKAKKSVKKVVKEVPIKKEFTAVPDPEVIGELKEETEQPPIQTLQKLGRGGRSGR